MLQASSCLRTLLRVCLVLLAFALPPLEAARADAIGALGKAWSCAKAAANGALTVNAELVKKADALAEASAKGSLCLAVQGGNAAPYAIALGALSAIKISSPNSLPNGECFSSVKQSLARPVAIGLSAAIPVDDIKQSLISLAESDVASNALWELMSSSPAYPYVVQVDCACTAIEAGVTLADMTAITGAIKAVSKECGGFLDEAGLGFLNDAGEAIVDGIVQFGEAGYDAASTGFETYVLGEDEREDDEVVYTRYFGNMVYWFAMQNAVIPNWTYQKGSAPGVDGGYQGTWKACYDYYLDHRVSKAHAKEICDIFGARFLSEMETQTARLLEFAALRTAVFPFLSKRIGTEWAYRLPLRQGGVSLPGMRDDEFVAQFREWTANEAMGEAFADTLGTNGAKPDIQTPWIYPDATGVTKAAREALTTIAETKEQAIEIAYAGILPELTDRVNLAWAKAAPRMFEYYLAKLTPAQPFSGRYNCPSGALEAACVKRLNYKFGAEETCFAGIYFAHAEAPNKEVMLDWLTTREADCAAALRDVTERSSWLADYELIDPASDAKTYCKFALGDRDKRAHCMAMLVDAANDCMATGIEKGQGDQKILDCYVKAGNSIRIAGMGELDVNDTPDIDEPLEDNPGVQVLKDQPIPGLEVDDDEDDDVTYERPQRRLQLDDDEEAVEDEEVIRPGRERLVQPTVRPQRQPEPVCPERLKRGEALPEGCPVPGRGG